MSKHVVITGAADGIGLALLRACIAREYQVTGIDMNTQRIQQLQTTYGDSATFIKTDFVHHADSIASRLQQPTDILIHNTDINAVGQFGQINPADHQALISVNLLAPMVFTADCLKQGLLTEQASVVFMSSLSHFVGYPNASVYAATQDGLAAYARNLAAAYRKLHVLTVYGSNSKDTYAEQILQAIDKRQRTLIPGRTNRALAFIGRLFPGLAHSVLRKRLF